MRDALHASLILFVEAQNMCLLNVTGYYFFKHI